MMQNLSGQRLGQYELRERLGRGGMAEVYKAYQPSMDRFVAVKVMLGHLAGDEGFIERFKREAQAVGKLRHPNILQVFDFGVEHDVYYMVMEYIRGENLKAIINQTRGLPVRHSLHITSQLAAALDYAHRAGMIHRDMKPANVMFMDDTLEQVVLTDFGIARILGQTGLTSSGAMVGTPAYISPEAARGDNTDERADLYGLGIILYETLTGKVPYDADTPIAVIMKHINAPLPMPKSYGIEIGEDVEKIILKSLAKEPNERFQTAAMMKAAVDAALTTITEEQFSTSPRFSTTKINAGTESLNTIVEGTAETVLKTDEPTYVIPNSIPAEATDITPLPVKNDTSMRRLSIAIGLLVIVAIIAGAVFLLSSGGEDDEKDEPQNAVVSSPTNLSSAEIAVVETPVETFIPITDTPISEIAVAETPEQESAELIDPPQSTLPAVTDSSDTGSSDTGSGDTDSSEINSEPPQTSEVVGAENPADTGTVRGLSGLTPLQDEVDQLILNDDWNGAFALIQSRLDANPDDVEALVAQAMTLSIDGNTEEAAEIAQRAIDLQPDSPLGYIALAEALRRYPTYDMNGTAAAAQQALDIDPDNPEALWRLAQAQWNYEDESESKVLLDRAISEGARGIYFNEFAAEYLQYTGEYERALPYARTNYNLYDSIWSLNYLASALMRTGQVAEAHQLYQDFTGDYQFTSNRINAAFVAYVAGDYTQARQIAEDALAQTESDTDTIRANYVLGLVSWEADNDAEAALSYFEAVPSEPVLWDFYIDPAEGHEVNLERARIYTAQGNYDAALAATDEAIRVLDGYYRAYEERGNVLLAMGDLQGALEAMTDAARAADIPTQQRLVTRIQDIEAQINAADTPPDESSSISTGSLLNPDELSVSALSGLSPLHDEIDQLVLANFREGALDRLNTILESDPDNIEALSVRAKVLQLDDQGENSLADANRAVELDPNNILGYLARFDALLYYSNADEAAALETIQQAAALDPNNPQVVWRQAYIDWIVGDNDTKAADEFRRADELGATGFYYASAAGLFWIREAAQFSDGYARAIPLLNTYLTYSPNDSDMALEFAYALIQTDRPDDARQIIDHYIPQITDPDDFGSLAYLVYRLGDYDQARRWVDTALSINGETYNAIYLAGLLDWYQNQDLQQAISKLDTLVGVTFYDPFINESNGHQVNIDRARIFAASGDLESARDAYQTAVDEGVNWRLAYPELATVQAQLGDTDDALQSLYRAYETIAWDDVFNLEIANTLHQQIVNTVWGEEAVNVANPPANLAQMATNLEINPLSGLSPLLDEVDQMAINGDRQQLYNYYTTLANSNDPEVISVHALLMWELDNQAEAAVAEADRAIEIAPNNLLPYLVKVGVWLDWYFDNPAAIVETAEVANALSPDNPQVLWLLASAQQRNGQAEEALANFTRAYELGAQGMRYADTAGIYWYESANNYERTIPLLKTACAIRPYIWECSALIGSLIQTGQIDEAYQWAQNLTSIWDQQEPNTYEILSYAAYRAGDYERARAWAQVAYAFQPEDGAPYYMLGLISGFADGDVAKSMEYLDKAEAAESYNDFLLNVAYGHTVPMDRARIYAYNGDVDAARTAYESALANGGTLDFYIERADFYLSIGDTAAARVDLQYAYDETDDPAIKQSLLDRLVELGPAQ